MLPILTARGEVVAVLDLDSTQLAVFDDTDVTHLQTVCQWLAERYQAPAAG